MAEHQEAAPIDWLQSVTVIEEILALLELDYDDWDCEGGLAIDPSMVSAAINMVTLSECEAVQRGLPWIEPEAGPDPCGGVDVSWENDKDYVLLIFHPSEQGSVVCVQKKQGVGPFKQTLTFDRAQKEVLDLLRSRV